MKTPCPACGGDTFGPYGPFTLSDQETDHSATLFMFECNSLDCIVQYYLNAPDKAEALQQWNTRAQSRLNEVM